MCGIVGIRRFDGQEVDARLLRAMAGQLAHRGPDDEGFWHRGAVGLGHRRLAIIDLAGSVQPMASPDGRHHITFNGEIFNYRALRAETPYGYRTDGDTEVILAAYDAHGAACAEHLRGQFAFALFDEDDESLWLYRDRLGVLPLYYYADGQQLIFASEVKALLEAMPAAPKVDEQSLDDYLSRRSVAAPYTLFDGVRKLPPGHRLRAGRGGDIRIEPYWSLPAPTDVLDVSDAAAVDLVRHALDDAVLDALVADVPVGAFLSGGVDSSLIVATATRLRGGDPVETFSAGFGDPRTDETHHARTVSRWLGSNHHEVVLSAADFDAEWSRLSWHRDGPISEPADIAVAQLAATARQHVKVVLSGEGSDELFAGYPKHRFAGWSRRAGLVPDGVRQPALRAVERALPSGQRRLRTAARALGAPRERLGEEWFAPFTAAERHALLGDLGRPPTAAPAGRSALDVMLRRDCTGGWLSDNLLERGDRMTMAASLELRPPFLDHRLVELAFRLPDRVKLRGRTGKWAVKALAEESLPAEIVHRRKAGFQVPLDAWFRGDLRDTAHDRLLSSGSFVTQVMDRTAVAALLRDHARGRRDEAVRIWTLMCLEVWHERFFGRSDRPLGAASPVKGS
jgi:asparagine synthase (glutamine-hydrolysing)